MTVDAQFALQIVIALCSGAGVYAAIRADLARLHERTQHAIDAAATANTRIDAILSK
ncbi:MAG: hypothetical protein ACOYB2_02930 [Limnohabitans sp.]